MESFWSRLDTIVKVRLPIVAGVVLVSVAAAALVTAPSRRTVGYEPQQPVAFSHKQHAGDMRIDCRYCHTGVETGRHAGIPATAVCMNCHSVAAVDSPGVAVVRQLYEQGQAVQWERIHRLPDYVYFAHDVHIAAGVDCRSCHGDVRGMEAVAQVHELSMSSCLRCHRHPQSEAAGVKPDLVGPENCSACHR